MFQIFLRLLTLAVTAFFVSAYKGEAAPASPKAPLYFPAVGSSFWETMTPQSLGWNTAALPELISFLNKNNTRAFLLLKDGKIVVEHYNGSVARGRPFQVNSRWYWASAGKTVTAFMVGKAQEDGYLSITDPTSRYLGNGWTSLAPAQEHQITIRHQLTMTTGLNDLVPNRNCTTPACLTYRAAPDTRWAYYNAPYTLLSQVVEKATKQEFQTYFQTQLRDKIGMDGQWRHLQDNYVYISTPRSMARFGLLMLNNGKWGDTPILKDAAFLNAMVRTSQPLNPSYGYLWWLNGKASFLLPTSQRSFSGSIVPNAPTDMYAALGKNGQFLNVVPSQGLVLVRMGEAPSEEEVPVVFLNEIWKRVNAVVKK
ncbi:serine hydrolase domain-containing protein [Rufibacter quisquiliarum]|uniref:CubicO group peptidase (Beta-lactamase class C family) n=1 Tax=Rufibacter quisquiliarum TaxID=1549639 RepID=A0A839GPC1_9BACT|nr:serine hydrolase domain-containing protein [Rufibacter quisquiliarum]MBA9079813.1 CubicO group peptidase (beta-lactamase class C family) [Rufibacter quisquiliarum]